MNYESPQALRTALEARLGNQSSETGIGHDRLRRRVLFERVVARLSVAEPGQWVLKGGMALEVRLRDEARLTKDIDLGLRDTVADREELHERLIEALSVDPFEDFFVLGVGSVIELAPDGAGRVTWRSSVTGHLAGREFGRVQLDVSPRPRELGQGDLVTLPNSLAFAGVEVPTVEIIDVNRHAAEKFHGMLLDFGERDNSRVRDLVDLVILSEHHLLTRQALAQAVRQVWAERDGVAPPRQLPPLPESWPDRYEQLAADHDLSARSFQEAVAIVEALWTDLLSEET